MVKKNGKAKVERKIKSKFLHKDNNLWKNY